MSEQDDECLIIGQGLAGTCLAWQVLLRGGRVAIIDEEVPVTSSKIAAGIMNPITGRYLAKSWRVDETWPAAKAFYTRIEQRTHSRFFHELPIVRLLRSTDEEKKWQQRCGDPEYLRYLDDPQPDDLIGRGFQMANCGWLDVAGFLAASREEFTRIGAYRKGVFDPSEAADASRRFVFCQGYKAARNPYFDWVPFKSAKGEILTLSASDLARDRILNRSGKWILPHADGTFRAGSTYGWNPLDEIPTPAAREEILKHVREITDVEITVTDQQAAVRPIINASKALLGRHPGHPHLAFFNGLGSKGALNAPFFAQQLAVHLVGNAEVDPEVDLRENF